MYLTLNFHGPLHINTLFCPLHINRTFPSIKISATASIDTLSKEKNFCQNQLSLQSNYILYEIVLLRKFFFTFLFQDLISIAYVHVHLYILVYMYVSDSKNKGKDYHLFLEVMMFYEWPSTILCEECDGSEFAV